MHKPPKRPGIQCHARACSPTLNDIPTGAGVHSSRFRVKGSGFNLGFRVSEMYFLPRRSADSYSKRGTGTVEKTGGVDVGSRLLN